MFKFMLCALDVGTHALHVVMQRILLRLRETVDQKTLHTLPVRFEIGDDGVGFIRQHNALTSCATDSRAISPFFSISASTRDAVERVMQNFCSMVC